MDDQPTRVDPTQLVAQHHQAVYRYAYRLSGSVPDAEDLTQQVFLLAQQKLGQLRDEGSAQAWLFAILRNCFLKARQQRRPVAATNVRLDMEAIPAEVPPDAEIDRDRLQEAVNRLPAPFRVVLLMFYYEGCSYRQIAEQLDLPIGTVMSRLSRAKRHLRSRLFGPQRSPTGTSQPSPSK
jgi:RNA polymerase sigma-70 factor (ECF subfamily)